MKTTEYLSSAEKFLMGTYRRYPVVLRKGRGTKVWDTDGKEYLDFVGGVATNVLGHCHPKLVVAIQKQAQRLLHVSNWFHIGPQTELAALLVENSFADKVFFCNSGTEANEAAIKLARKWAVENMGPGRDEIITAESSFHGRTMGSLAATGQEKLKKGFEPLPGGFVHVPFDDPDAIERAVTGRTCAVMLEPILGESGVVVPSPGYLKEVRSICDKKGLLLILDEVQTGMGRTGTLFAYEHEGITPDIITLAKGLGGGVPIGAMLATDKAASAFKPGDHGSTFGGNPLACAAATATLETVLEGGIILDQCNRMGSYLREKLEKLRIKHGGLVKEVRGMGLLAGVVTSTECADIVKGCMDKGVLLNCTAGNVVRFMPPLIVSGKEIDIAVEVLDGVLAGI